MKSLLIISLCISLVLQSFGDTLKLAAGLTVEPYIIKDENSGFELDIVREAFSSEGYKITLIYQPLRRTKISFKEGIVDGVMAIKEHYPEIKNGFISDFYITYHNYAVSLSSKKFQINSIQDLSDKNIIAFQQAKNALGKDFKAMAENNPNYVELSRQNAQIAMLFMERTDVIILDKHIFAYHRNRLNSVHSQNKVPAQKRVIFHNLFEPSSFKMAFREKRFRDAFDRGLKKLKESGRYQEIIDSYINNTK